MVIILEFDADQAAKFAGAGKMLIVEFLFTFALAYVVLNVGHRRAQRALGSRLDACR